MGAQGSTERSIEIENRNGPSLEYKEQQGRPQGKPAQKHQNQPNSDDNSLEVKAEDLEILKHSIGEDYVDWVKGLEEENQGITIQTKERYIQQADQLRQRFKYVESNPRCVLPLREVQQCYEANSHEPLNCADSVQYFKDCVHEAQANFKCEPAASGGNS